VNLREYQQAVVRVSLAEETPLAELSRLGEEQGFALYRHMIRTRLLGMTKIAFQHSHAAASAAAFEACFARYLAARPPQSPFIRDVVADFAPFARADAALLAEGAAFLSDLLAFEEHKWRLSYLAGAVPSLGEDGLRELDFEGRPVWNFSLRVLPLAYAVHVSSSAPGQAAADLLMYRPHGVDEVRWYVGDPFFVALLTRSWTCAETLAELVQRVAAGRAQAVDTALLESLATSLTLALERGLLLGVR
jgi:hypothetical protein